MEALITKINEQIEAFTTNADRQLLTGNKAAGIRARKASLELAKLLHEFRKVSIEAAK